MGTALHHVSAPTTSLVFLQYLVKSRKQQCYKLVFLSVKSQTFHFAVLASPVDDLKQTRFHGEVVVDEVDEAVAITHTFYDTSRLRVLGIQATPLLPPQVKRLILIKNSTLEVSVYIYSHYQQ